MNIPTGGQAKVELTMDVLNLLNLFDSSNGWSLFPNFNGPTVDQRKLRRGDRQDGLQPVTAELPDLRHLRPRQPAVALAGTVGTAIPLLILVLATS